MNAEELQELTNLVTSPGWLAFERFARQQFKLKLEQDIEAAASLENPQEAVIQMRQVIAAKRAVERVLAWPREQIAHYTNSQEPVTSFSRGGL